MYAYLFWDKIRPKMAKILQFYVIRDQKCKPVCSFLRVYVYLRAESNSFFNFCKILVKLCFEKDYLGLGHCTNTQYCNF